jgi:spermidine/putrescine transport system permease protein
MAAVPQRMSSVAETTSSGRPRSLRAASMAFLRGAGARILRDPIIPLFLLGWGLLVVLPLIILVCFSFFESRNFMMVYQPSLRTWAELFASGRFEVLARTLRVALDATAIDLLVGFPFALWLAKGEISKSARSISITLLTIPFFLDLSSRIFVWRGVLDEHGLVNTILLHIGLIHAPLGLLYGEGAVTFGVVLTNFPLMVLPIYSALATIDDTLLAAAADLGAPPGRILRDIVFPLALPGIVTGIVFTLGPALAAWVEPMMLGGGFVTLLSGSIESAYEALRYPTVAALSTFAILVVIAILWAFMTIFGRFIDVKSLFRNING